MGNFDLLHTSLICDKIPVSVYISRKSGLTVAIAETNGPIVKGFFCIATETFDDDGIPHILEHTVYSGSKKYPYKRAIELLANRCLGREPVAGSTTHDIRYIMETAGSEGFLTLMSIFLDYIFHPLLTEESFLTEVHHITGKGLDAGLVYSEMQETDYEYLRLDLIVAKNIYPGRCGYSSETCGYWTNLRESVNMTKVREFHKKFHRPENLKIIIIGQIKPDDVFRTLETFEETIITEGGREPFQRPWQNPPPPLIDSKDVTVTYPSEEANGVFSMAWRTASCATDSYTIQAIDILLNYLTCEATSPLRTELVDTEPYAPAGITSSLTENSETCASITLHDVPVNMLPEVKTKLRIILKKILENEDIDMELIEANLKNKIVDKINSLDMYYQNTISFMIIAYMVYGNNTTEEFQRLMNPQRELTKLLKEPKSFWLELLKKYLVDNKYVAIHGLPSKEEKVKLIKEEEKRIEAQIRRLAESGLKEKADELEKAIKLKEREPPMDMITSVPIPSIDSIKFHKIFRYRTDSDQQSIDLSQTPIFTYFDNLNSNLLHISALLNTADVPTELRSYLPLLLKSLRQSPIERDGKIVPYEEFMAQLKRDIESDTTSLGYDGQIDYFECGNYSQICVVTLNVETSKYEIGLNLLKELLYKTIFTAERLKTIALKIKDQVAITITGASIMVSYAVNGMCFSQDSNIIKSGLLHQRNFLIDLIQKLDSNANQVLESLEKLRKIITKPSNTVLYIAGNLDHLKDPVKPLSEFLPSELEVTKPPRKLNLTPDYKFLKPIDSTSDGCIIALDEPESSTCFYQATESIKSYTDPDMPVLMLYLQYITENPKWKRLLAKEYFYHGKFMVNVNKGLIYLIYRDANNVIEAYQQTKEFVCKQLITKEWNDLLLEIAKSSLIVDLVRHQDTITDVIHMSITSYLSNMDYNYNRNLLDLINKVTIEDLNRVGEKYISSIFDSNKTKIAVMARPSQLTEISDGFKKLGLNLTVYSSVEDSFLNTL